MVADAESHPLSAFGITTVFKSGVACFPSFWQATLFYHLREEGCLMCGRFARYSLSRKLERYFNAHPAALELQPNYNVAPTQEIPVIVLQESERHIKNRHWGLVPY